MNNHQATETRPDATYRDCDCSWWAQDTATTTVTAARPGSGKLYLIGGAGEDSDGARADARRHARQILGDDAVIIPRWEPGTPARFIRYDPATGAHVPGEADYPAVVTGNDGEFVTATYDAGYGPGTGGPVYLDQAGLWTAIPHRWRLIPADAGADEAAPAAGTQNQGGRA